mmetsp:Transcript_4394/g.4912  ORF Transcript_4394/g.4912 Transcript_4394/m.4912 type:complete len:139 (+) Transcript_4394:232-648(+)
MSLAYRTRRHSLPTYYKDGKDPEYRKAIDSANSVISGIQNLKEEVVLVKKNVEQSKIETSQLIERYKEVFEPSTDDSASEGENDENQAIASNKCHHNCKHNHKKNQEKTPFTEIPSTLIKKSQGVLKTKRGQKPGWRY